MIWIFTFIEDIFIVCICIFIKSNEAIIELQIGYIFLVLKTNFLSNKKERIKRGFLSKFRESSTKTKFLYSQTSTLRTKLPFSTLNLCHLCQVSSISGKTPKHSIKSYSFHLSSDIFKSNLFAHRVNRLVLRFVISPHEHFGE